MFLLRMTALKLPERSPGLNGLHAKDVRTLIRMSGRRPYGLAHLLRGNWLRMASSHLTHMFRQPIMRVRVNIWSELMRRNFIIQSLTHRDYVVWIYLAIISFQPKINCPLPNWGHTIRNMCIHPLSQSRLSCCYTNCFYEDI